MIDGIELQSLVAIPFTVNRFSKWLSLIGRTTLLAKGLIGRTTLLAKGMDHVSMNLFKELIEEVNNLLATSTQGLDSVEGSAELIILPASPIPGPSNLEVPAEKIIILPASPIPGPSNLEVPAEKIKISKRKDLTKGHLLRQINVTRKECCQLDLGRYMR
ncbi:hypothetical protein QE152_g327 [Popillia japonica]|uniref:Uncharacterized protein n=1 Tax=Popillia japonica TaxID=7064 RepID=A0AAW1NKM0_POPJA